MRNIKRIIAIILCVVMIGSVLPLGSFAAEGEVEYTLYPIPHEITYQDGSYELKDINVIYGNGIDEATEARMAEVAALRELTITEGTAADSSKTNVYVAINGSGDAVEAYIKANYTVDTALFAKTDANFVASNDGEIVVLGKDVDSCFYGLTTVYQIFGQLTENSLRNFVIEDYADVASRGFIEGYYGNPWSTEDRINLMTWGGYYKLNSYFYAPKDDPKHNSKWRELYTEEEIKTLIKPLAEAGNASKCRFVYALHPYMHNPITDSNYDTGMAAMKAKFKQVIDAGVRQIAILADDAGNQGGTHYTRMLTDMTAWIEDLRTQEEYADLKLLLPFCTQEYMYNGESYYSNFPENVQIVMTGGKIWGEVSNEFTSTFSSRTGRGPYLWINWPCTDNSKKHLIMGGYTTFLQVGVDPSKLEGIVLNPMQQSEPSKVAIFGNACYTWNIWETEAEANVAYDVSFACVDHNSVVPNDASNALKEISKHMINQNMDSRVTALQESVELKAELNTFKSKLTAGTYTQAEVDSLIEEFTILQNAAKTFRAEGNEAVADQIVYWLDCWDDTTTAVIAYLNALAALKNGADDAVVWDYYAAGQAAMDASKTHALWYLDHYEYAEVGVQHIVPFMTAMDQVLAQKVATIVDPGKVVAAYITNRQDNPGTGSIANITDGDDATSAIYKSPSAIYEGDYVGLMYNRVMNIKNIHIVLGAGKDHFDHGKLQYTMDGSNWEDMTLVGMENSFAGVRNVAQVVDVAQENLPENFKAMGIRFVATVDNAADAWLEVREVSVNKENDSAASELTATAFHGNIPAEGIYDGALANVADGDTSSYVWYKGAGKVGQYIGVDLGKTVKIGSVKFSQDSGDCFNSYDLEYSVDGQSYTVYGTYSDASLEVDLSNDEIEARYIRFNNKTATSNWVKIAEIAVAEASQTCVMTNNAELASLATKVESDSAELVSTGSITLNPGEYIGFDLLRIRDLAQITVADQGALTLEVSKNMAQWDAVSAGAVEKDGRYVRLINNTDAAVTVNLTEFSVTSNEITGPYLYETTMGINGSWGVAEDCRENGAAFDGKVSTITEFGDLPQKDQYIIYDLGQQRDIYKLEIYCADSAVNYIRDAVMQVSNDLEDWQTVLTIGDGVENTADANITCINSDAGYSQATSTYPNYVSIEGTIEATPARYIRILMTATNNNRAVVFNEIEINDNEYVSVINDPTFETSAVEVQGFAPQNMIDGDLTTGYKANTNEAGYVVYNFSDNLTANRINIVQKGVSNAKVSLLVKNDGETKWVEAGKLDKSLVTIACNNELNLALKIEWTAGNTPTITEIVRYTDDGTEPDVPDTTEPQETTPEETKPEDTKPEDTKPEDAKPEDTKPEDTKPEDTKPDASEPEYTVPECDKDDNCTLSQFEDIKVDDWYHDGIHFCVNEGIMNGMGEGKFAPNENTTRAQLVMMLYRLAGAPDIKGKTEPFSDVADTDWFYAPIVWAYENKVVNGVSDTEFAPNAGVTREQVATILYRYLDTPNGTGKLEDFLDAADVSGYAVDAMTWAVGEGLITGIAQADGTALLAPTGNATRAQIATILMRYLTT